MVRVLKKSRVTFILYPVNYPSQFCLRVVITSNSILNISNSIGFTIDKSVGVVSDRKHEEKILKVLIIIQTLSSMKFPWIHTDVLQMKLF